MSKRVAGLYRIEGEERQPEDFYASDPAVIPPLLKILGTEWESGGKLIYENACGQGHFRILTYRLIPIQYREFLTAVV